LPFYCPLHFIARDAVQSTTSSAPIGIQEIEVLVRTDVDVKKANAVSGLFCSLPALWHGCSHCWIVSALMIN
jgi:hypothetical protein